MLQLTRMRYGGMSSISQHWLKPDFRSRLSNCWMLLYDLDILLKYHLRCLCNDWYSLSALVCCWSSVCIRRMFYNVPKCKCGSFWIHIFFGKWDGWDPVNQFSHTCFVDAVYHTDRAESVRNRFVIDFLWCFYVVTSIFGAFYWCNCLCHMTESAILSVLSEYVKHY